VLQPSWPATFFALYAYNYVISADKQDDDNDNDDDDDDGDDDKRWTLEAA